MSIPNAYVSDNCYLQEWIWDQGLHHNYFLNVSKSFFPLAVNLHTALKIDILCVDYFVDIPVQFADGCRWQ